MRLITDRLKEYGADVDGALERFVGDEDLYITCISTFLRDTGFLEVVSSIQKESYAEAFEYAHALKGVAGNLGLQPLYYSLSSLVEKLRNKEYNDIEKYCGNVIKSYEELKSMEQYI